MDSTYNSFPQAPSEDVILGTREGRSNLSPVRRFFCLLVTFDLLFTTLLWILCVILVKGQNNLVEVFKEEIVSYGIKVSSFDAVMCAGSRFVILLLFYATLQCHHWLPVAFTTAGSCAFLLAKVLLFNWSEYGGGSPWPVMLILGSFILSWSEAWFLDFRVVPIERQAAIYYSRQAQGVGGNGFGVAPWLRASSRHTGGLRSYPDSISNFYSPLESPYHSDDNESSETESNERRKAAKLDSGECKMFISQGPVIVNDLLAKISSSGWVLEKTTEDGDTVFSQKLHRKIFMISGSVCASPATIAYELFNNVERMPSWNSTVKYCQVIQKLNDFTDVTYQVSKEAGGGVIQSRDFVTLRHHQINHPNGNHAIAYVSVKHPEMPIQPKITRGTNGVAGWTLIKQNNGTNYTDFQWVLDVDLQLSRFIPTKAIDSAFISAALDTIKALRQRMTYAVDHTIDIDIAVDLDVPSSSNSNNPLVPVRGTC